MVESRALPTALAARSYITTALKREFASDSGTELNAVLPKMSPLNPQYLTKKQSVFQKRINFLNSLLIPVLTQGQSYPGLLNTILRKRWLANKFAFLQIWLREK